MKLENLGWDRYFEEKYQEYGDPDCEPARVAVEQKNWYLVYCENGELPAHVSGKFRYIASCRSDYPAVGDWVIGKRSPNNDSISIQEVLPRKSCFSRRMPASGGKKWVKFGGRSFLDSGVTEEQVLASNIDTVCIVIGLDQNFSVGRIERYLTSAYSSGASPVIVLNKKDLCPDYGDKVTWTQTVAFDVPVYAVSAAQNIGLEIFNKYLIRGKTLAFLGSSGVGKSTIINKLIGEERQKVNTVSSAVGKGKHTTTYRELILHPGNGIILDTPGMRELQIWGEADNLTAGFADIEHLFNHCRFRNCNHKTEPGCAVREALENGSLSEKRYKSYMKQKFEMQYLAMKKDQRARCIDRTKHKRIFGKK